MIFFFDKIKKAEVVLLLLKNQMVLTALLVLLILITILLGGALTLIERKILAILQRRVGPNIVGHRGRLQFIADAVKVLLKEVIFLKNVNTRQHILLPTVFLIINIQPFIYLT